MTVGKVMGYQLIKLVLSSRIKSESIVDQERVLLVAEGKTVNIGVRFGVEVSVHE